MSETENRLLECRDGLVWAQEFNKRFPSVAVDDALGWFCSAIETGATLEHRKQQNKYAAIHAATSADLKLSALVSAAEALCEALGAKVYPVSESGVAMLPIDDAVVISLRTKELKAHLATLRESKRVAELSELSALGQEQQPEHYKPLRKSNGDLSGVFLSVSERCGIAERAEGRSSAVAVDRSTDRVATARDDSRERPARTAVDPWQGFTRNLR